MSSYGTYMRCTAYWFHGYASPMAASRPIFKPLSDTCTSVEMDMQGLRVYFHTDVPAIPARKKPEASSRDVEHSSAVLTKERWDEKDDI